MKLRKSWNRVSPSQITYGTGFAANLAGLFGLRRSGNSVLIVGFGTRWLGVLFAIEMLVTRMMVKSRIGFIAAQGQPGVGFELDLMLLAAGLSLAILGSGQLSVESNLLRMGSAQWQEARQGVRSPTD